MNETLRFKAVTKDDFPLLTKWRREAHVMKWWGDKSEAQLYKEFEKEMADPLVERYVVSDNLGDFGFLQVCDAHRIGDGWWPDAQSGTMAIDYLIGVPERLGQGLGTALIKTYSDHLLALPDVKLVVADPEPDNTASIRALEKAGFAQAGLIDTPDGLSLLVERRAES